MKVPKYNYAAQFGSDLADVVRDIATMLREGNYILTEDVQRFEEQYAMFLNISDVVGTNTGTDALVLALMALSIGQGDEVITQANTFHATVAAIRLVGATPVLVDANEDSFLIESDAIEAAVTCRTRAVIPVHLYGKPTPMTSILELAARSNFFVIEDAAQSHGAKRDGKFTGTSSAMGCFSFHPSKNLGAAGDAGAVATSDPALAKRIRLLRGLGQRQQNDHVAVSLNSKLDAIQARILSMKLPKLLGWNKRRRQIAAHYRQALRDLPLQFQSTADDEEHAFHLFQIGTRDRDALLEFLIGQGVEAVVRYPVPIHLQPAFADIGWRRGQFPVAERLANELIAVPIRPDMSEDEINYVIQSVRSFFVDRRVSRKQLPLRNVSLKTGARVPE